MNSEARRTRVLDPLERFSEIVFGLIMVLSFTCAMGLSATAREDVRTMFIGAIGCNLAWGIIDAAFYLIACLTERGRAASLLRTIRQATTPAQERQTLADAIPEKVAEVLDAADYERIVSRLKGMPSPPGRPHLTLQDGAAHSAFSSLFFFRPFRW